MWGATLHAQLLCCRIRVSIHAPRVGGDAGAPIVLQDIFGFNPRPPCGGRPIRCQACAVVTLFQSTPPVWGATIDRCELTPLLKVSIHAPRVGGDRIILRLASMRRGFNPRPPCGGRRRFGACHPPLRRFNPRPPCWGRRWRLLQHGPPVRVSIHAPRGGGVRDLRVHFQPVRVSIHAPRVGGDAASGSSPSITRVSIHAPRVGGDISATGLSGSQLVSIHAPRVGGDFQMPFSPELPQRFNPRPPCGGLLPRPIVIAPVLGVSIHAPRVGGDGFRL